MALLFCDSFDHYAQDNLDMKYDGAYNWTSSYLDIETSIVRSGAQCLAIKASASNYVNKNLPSSVDTCIVGMGIYIEGFQTNDVIQLYNADGVQLTLSINADGSITVRRGTSGGTVLDTSDTGVITSTTWHHLEFKAFVDNSTGTIEVKVDGNSINCSASGADTQNQTTSGITYVRLNGMNSFSTYIDDLFILDDSGSYNNDFLGDMRIDCLMPDGAGNSADWTPSTGNNYENVDDSADIDEDGTYNSETSTGDHDSYTFDNLATLATDDIKAVVVNISARKDDAGTKAHRAVTRVNSTDYFGSSQSVGDTYEVYQEVWEVNPDDSSAWAEADVNGAEFGIELYSST